MPLYDYECEDHGVFEAVAPMAKSDKKRRCPVCNKPSRRIMSVGHGGIQESTAPEWMVGRPWQKDYRGSSFAILQEPGTCDKPWETRQEFDAHLKKHGLVQGPGGWRDG